MILEPNNPSLATLRVRKERRFTGETVKIPWWRVLWTRVLTGEVVTEKFVFTEVKEGDPGYADAPYAETFITHKQP